MMDSHMKSKLRLFFLITAAFLACPLHANDAWIPLFNGKSLDGWKANADPGAFSVTNGVLKAHATHPHNRSHLFTVGKDGELAKFKDFELEAVVRGEPKSNSGIFFHTDMETRDGVLHLQNGYEVQLNTNPREKRKTGSLYDVVDFNESAVSDETDWFTVKIRVEGKRIQVWLNGKPAVDYTEPSNVVAQRSVKRKGRYLRDEGGAIALQAHDVQSTFYFKSIRLRRLH